MQAFTDLILSIRGGELDGVQRALAAGASVHQTTPMLKSTALHEAISRDSMDIARLVLDAGPKLDAADALGDQPLHLAAKNRTIAESMVSMLLARGADAAAVDGRHENALHHAAHHGAHQVIPLLVAAGTPLEGRDTECITPLLQAIARDQVNSVRALLMCGADVSVLGKWGENVLQWADRHDAGPQTHLLLRAWGAQPFESEKSPWISKLTEAEAAVRCESIPRLKHLLEHKPLEHTSDVVDSLTQLALDHRYEETAAFLRSHQAMAAIDGAIARQNVSTQVRDDCRLR